MITDGTDTNHLNQEVYCNSTMSDTKIYNRSTKHNIQHIADVY